MRKLGMVLSISFVVSFLIACESPVQPTLVSLVNTTYEPISINPQVRHMKTGETAEFRVGGGDGAYVFNLFTSAKFAVNGAIDCSCMFNVEYDSNKAILTLVNPKCTGWNFSEVHLNVRSFNNNGWPTKALIVID